MPPLRPGRGAKGSILTRFIKPDQVIPNNDKNHRSVVVIQSRFADKKGSAYYKLKYDGVPDGELLTGSSRLVKIEQEGPVQDLFVGEPPCVAATEQQNKKYSWKHSKARKLLYDDLRNGLVPLEKQSEDDDETFTDEYIYTMHPEYAEYEWDMFPARLRSLRDIVKGNNSRAAQDEQLYNVFKQTNNVSYFNRKGSIQWQGSIPQQLARDDLENKEIWKACDQGNRGYKMLYLKREEYYTNYDYYIFKDYIKQEIKTAKMHYTMKRIRK